MPQYSEWSGVLISLCQAIEPVGGYIRLIDPVTLTFDLSVTMASATPDLRPLPSQPQSLIAQWQVTIYTAW